jgi:hypothetical protein
MVATWAEAAPLPKEELAGDDAAAIYDTAWVFLDYGGKR